MYFSEDLKPGMRGYLKKSIWTSVIQGAAGVVFGVYTFVSPIGTLNIFLLVIGLLLLVHGILLMVSSVMGISRDNMWFVIFAAGVLQLLIGLFIVTKPEGLSTMEIMLSTVGLGLIGVVTGTISLITAIRYKDVAANVWAFISRGGLLFIIGITMLLAPFGFGTAMVRSVGLIAVALGSLQIWGAFKLFIEVKS